MAITRSTPITQEDMQALADLANRVLLPLVNANIKGDGTGALDTGWLFAGGVAVSWSGANFYDIPASTADGEQYCKSPQPDYSFADTTKWLSELNRIRGDYWNLIFGIQGSLDIFGNRYGNSGNLGSPVFLLPENVLSGPWIVGVNDPVTFPMGDSQGNLISQNAIFKNVEFWGNESDLEELSMAIEVSIPTYNDFLNGQSASTDSASYNFTLRSGIAATGVLHLAINLLGAPLSDNVISLTGATLVSQSIVPGSGAFIVNLEISVALVVGDNDVSMEIHGTWADFSTPVSMDTLTINGSTLESGQIAISSDAVSKIKSPQYGGAWLIIMGSSGNGNPYGQFATTTFILSEPTVPGVWVANTLPVPGQNVFLDQDMPPYVGAYEQNFTGSGAKIAVSGTLYYLNDFLDNPPTGQPNNSEPRFESSMRQQARGPQDGFSYDIPFWDDTETYPYGGGATAANGDLYYSLQNGNLNHPLTDASWWSFLVPASENSRSPKYNLINQSCQPQAAQWLVRRDTDFIPFSYGFNDWESQGTYSSQLAVHDPGNTGTHLNLNIVSVGAGATAVRIRLVAAGTAEKGWQDGVLQYGDDLATNLKILVRQDDYATKSVYDFATVNNAVTIDGTNRSDGGRGYLTRVLNSGFYFSVQNLTGADVEYDVIIEVDYKKNQQRQYFPPCSECFSYAIDGTPPANYTPQSGSKPVPQSGYCIFKVRATRLPVQNGAGISVTPATGDEINILLGQNILQPDGTLSFSPFMNLNAGPGAGDDTGPGAGDTGTGVGGSGTPATLTIPATARDTGDVDVFIPVLSGNELVWQSDDDVIVEAWANWQPIFFSAQYGTNSPYATFDATAFQYCLAFANQFDPYFSNFPGYGPYSPEPKVKFPPSVEIFDDLEACLNLI